MAEFGSFVTLGVNPQHAEYLEHKLAQFPKGTKALSRQLVTWDVIRVETAAVDNIELDSWTSRGIDKQGDWHRRCELCRLGIPSDPGTFVHRAVLAGHPGDLVGQIGELLLKTILMNFYQPPHELAKNQNQLR